MVRLSSRLLTVFRVYWSVGDGDVCSVPQTELDSEAGHPADHDRYLRGADWGLLHTTVHPLWHTYT